jgi:hypothetical protein
MAVVGDHDGGSVTGAMAVQSPALHGKQRRFKISIRAAAMFC